MHGGLALDMEACRLLFELAVRGADVIRARDGYAPVPVSTSSLLNMLATAGGLTRTATAEGSVWDAAAVLGTRSTHADTYTVTEAATRWGCTPSYVRRLCREDRVPAAKSGDGWSIPGDYVRQHTRPPRPETGDGNAEE